MDRRSCQNSAAQQGRSRSELFVGTMGRQRSSNGEIRVSGEGIVFAVPVLIVHYIEVHSYLPPAQFLKAVDESLIS
jgi:hypothetical protein